MTRPEFTGDISDVFDSIHYLQLLTKFITIKGKEQKYHFGEFDTDIFLGLMLDGVALFKGLGARRSKHNYTCWPIEVVIYNFSPLI